mmetsp:Transcript_36406/g.104314  ORF Transcript_36406/g.104314 Transcript_36406/m.104314 type:complete len:205 (+) Transcript_36406:362-976(+)
MGLQYTPVHTLGKVPCLVSVEVLRVAVNVTPHALQPPVCLPSAAHREGEVSRHRILAIGWRDVLLPCARLGGPETEECDFDLALDEEVGAEDGEGGEEGQQVSQHDDLLVTRSEDPNEVSAFLQVEQRQLRTDTHTHTHTHTSLHPSIHQCVRPLPPCQARPAVCMLCYMCVMYFMYVHHSFVPSTHLSILSVCLSTAARLPDP